MIKERQAVWDKTMPQLEKAVNAEYMGPIIENFLKREYPGYDLKFKKFRVGRVFHRPGKDCRILYRVCYKYGESKYRTLLLNAITTSQQNGYEKKLKQMRDDWPGCGLWKPVSYLSDLHLKLYTFPYDPKLPFLGQLLDAETVLKLIAENLSGFGLTDDWKCHFVLPQIRKYRPYKRCLLRYRATFENSSKEKRNVLFFGKTYNTKKSRYVYHVLKKITESPDYKNGALNIPQPIAHIDAANTIWQLAWRSVNLSWVIEKKYGWERLPESGLLPKIARMLAALHRVEIPESELQPGPNREHILENTKTHAAAIRAFLPERKILLNETIDAFAKLAPRADSNIPKATIHGTFKLAQILYRDGTLVLVDFDSVASGDPLYDVAEFATSLVFLSVSDGVSETSTSKSLETFLAEYEKRTPWTCDRQRLAWYMVAFLLGKIHATLKRAEAKGVKIATDGFSLVQKWLAVAGE